MLEDVAGSRTFSTASPDSATSVTCAQCEPAFIFEEHRPPVANLPILVFSGKCQMSCTVLGCKHNPHLWTLGPHTSLMESVSDRLSRHMHICGLLEVILQGSGSAPPVPPCTKVEVAVLLLGINGVDYAHVFISTGENVHLPCNNALPDCNSTTWSYNYRYSAAIELIGLEIKKNNTERHERLSLGSDCSLNIKNITKEDYGYYICQKWTGVNGQKWRTDAHVYLHVLHVSSSSSQTEISPGSSVTLSCQLYSYSHPGVSCEDWIRSEGIELFWVNQIGVKLTISDSRYQILFTSLHCISTLTTRLLNEDDNREWRCEVTHRNHLKNSATNTVKKPAQDTTTTAVTPVHITKSIVIIVEFAVFAAPTVILLQIICARRAERKDSQHRDEIVMNTILE
ncbi:uncharacterized protein [Garra rufa]|uniref:uncharacterized protein n=1 Tax=Garra rufa TaxID=137080 RepID=UPI003CCEB85D